MIFVTVGEQLPFDRLVRTVDEWAAASEQEVFAQTGRTGCKLVNIKHQDFLPPEQFKEKFVAADFIVAHAGMGTIIAALEMGKPILIMPRRANLGETRNDHQAATAKRFLAQNYVSVAFDEKELLTKLDNLRETAQGQAGRNNIGPSPLLLKTIRDFIEAP